MSIMRKRRRDSVPSYSLAVVLGAVVITAFSLFGIYYMNAKTDLILENIASGSALSEDLCLPFEPFDQASGACKPECSFAEDCPSLEKNYQSLLSILSPDDLMLYFAFYATSTGENMIADAEYRYENPIDMNLVANRTYAVKNGVLAEETDRTGNPIFPRESQEIWDLFQPLVPKHLLGYIDEILLLNDTYLSVPATGALMRSSTTTWQVMLNTSAMFTFDGFMWDRGQVIHTLTHEVGHLLTLNESQIDPYAASSTCTTYYVVEGCAKPRSYLLEFVQDFWPWEYGKEESPSGLYFDSAYVSWYAADNPVEDIAETWSAFLLFPKPVGHSIAERKILFFYQYPELIEFRRDFREHVGKIR